MYQPYYIVPLLVEQPTWGGEYIAEFKHIIEPKLQTLKIGQAFELYDQSCVIAELTDHPTFAFAAATQLNKPQFYFDQADRRSLQSLIAKNPEDILGSAPLHKYGPSMQVLIKFTQAKNNSYQVHCRPGTEFGHWQAKPESWYFFEPGLATLGLAPQVDVHEYKKRCLEVDLYAQRVSQEVRSGKKTISDGRAELIDFINQSHPRQFVNTISVKKGQVIDLSGGGVHHSWEVDPTLPLGNIVYEVQKNVMDDVCTLRSFDQGNIKDDGKVRPLSIEDYFTALDTTPAHNQPAQYSQLPKSHQEGSATVTPLFKNQYYVTTKLEFSKTYQGKHTQTDHSFHHLFVQHGSVEVITADGSWPVHQGWSIFIPAAIHSYTLSTTKSANVIQTTVQ